MSHTKGPWRIGTYKNSNSAYIADETGHIFYEETTTEYPANPSARCHLVSSAPEMLEALEEFLQPEGGEWSPDFLEAFSIHARAVVAKARGEK